MGRCRLALGAVVGIVMVLTTVVRVSVWTDERALWAQAAQLAPLKPRVWVNLGKQRQLAGDAGGAEQAYQQALTTSASAQRSQDERLIGRTLAETNLALLRVEQGRMTDAWILIQHARSTAPNSMPEIAQVQLWIDARR